MKRGIFILLIILCSCRLGEELPTDQEVWEYAYPSTTDVDPVTLYEIDNELKEASPINGLIIIKNDKLIFENYYNNSFRYELMNIGFSTFTVISLAMEIFVEEDLIDNIDDPIYTYLPEYESIFEEDNIKKEITFRHILTYKMGLSWDENGIIQNDFGNMKKSEDWIEFILSKPRDAPNPGIRFSPNSAGAIIIAKVLQNQLDDTSLEDFLKVNFFDRIGIHDYLWEKSPHGILNAANGLQLTTIDQTRIGYLMMLEGRWLDKQRIISRDWVFEVSSPLTPLNPQYSYGLGWRVFTKEYKQDLQLEETSTYYTYGGSGQGIFIIPEYKMIVSLSAENYFNDAETTNFFIFSRLLESLQPVTEN